MIPVFEMKDTSIGSFSASRKYTTLKRIIDKAADGDQNVTEQERIFSPWVFALLDGGIP